MGASILQEGCMIKCPHGGVATVVTQNRRVKVGGSYALLASDIFTIAGCPLNISGAPHPCVTIEWVNEARRVKVNGIAVLLETSVGVCKAIDQAVQGSAIVTGIQTRVKGV